MQIRIGASQKSQHHCTKASCFLGLHLHGPRRPLIREGLPAAQLGGDPVSPFFCFTV